MIRVEPGKGQAKETLLFSLNNTRAKSEEILYISFYEQNNNYYYSPPFTKSRLIFT